MYTVEIYKQDRRVKSGERLVEKRDLGDITHSDADGIVMALELQGYRVTLHETYVTRTNLMGGGQFQERYDTPYYCSPSSESYWSM
jgi:hypothetical protein